MKKIHIGFLLSYDYEKLKSSIPPVYEQADAIFIARDHLLRTWNGQQFEVKDSFYDWLTAFDVQNKIQFYDDNFYVSSLTAIQNDTRERYMLSKKMGIGNWLIQVDSDEIFIDFDKFVSKLKQYDSFLKNPKKTPIQIAGFLVNIYKYLDDGLLYVDKPTKVLLATNLPNYKYARQTKERVIYTNNILLHECLSRTESELRYKFENWGHSHEINSTFFQKWKSANSTNYKDLKDVFYLDSKIWKSLGFLPTLELSEIRKLIENGEIKVSKTKLFFRNFGQWFKHLFKKKKTDFESYFDL